MKVVYTLSGGAAYGYAHVGVLKYLEENHVFPSAIVGTSMGAIVGGLYSYGYDAGHIREISEHVRSIELVRLFFPSFPRGGIIDTDGIRDFFYGFIQDARIEDLPVAFRSVAVDIETGDEIVFDKGRLIDAVMASMSIPAVFKPYHFQGRYLVDGGLVNNLPWDIAQNMGDMNIVVDVAPRTGKPNPDRVHTSELFGSASGKRPGTPRTDHAPGRFENRLRNEDFRIHLKKLVQAIQNREEDITVRDMVNSFSKLPAGKKESQSIPEIITRVMAINNEYTQKLPEKTRIRTLYLHIDLMDHSLNDFHKADEIINRGYQTASGDERFVSEVRKIAKKSGQKRIASSSSTVSA